MSGFDDDDDDERTLPELPKCIFLGLDNPKQFGYESDSSHELYFGELRRLIQSKILVTKLVGLLPKKGW